MFKLIINKNTWNIVFGGQTFNDTSLRILPLDFLKYIFNESLTI